MKETAGVLHKLLLDGELSSTDSAFYAKYREPGVREELDIWGEELGYTLVEIRDKIYLIPSTDSELLSFSMRDIRESESKGGRMVEAFLQCYVSMTILWMLYGGKNNNPKRVLFLQVKDIVEVLDERFSDIGDSNANIFENDYEINFRQIAAHWSALPVYDDAKRKTRIEFVLRACRQMERQKLLCIVDDNREIRPTERLDNLMIGYYLDIHRIEDIHRLFDSMGDSSNAKDKQD